MQLIYLFGARNVVEALADIPGLIISAHSGEGSDAAWQMSAYATDEAIAEAERRGVTVRVVMSAAQVAAAIAEGRARSGRG